MDYLISPQDLLFIFDLLKKLSCCDRCIVRFLSVHVSDNEGAYKNPKDYLKEKLNITELINDEYSNNSQPKRLKKNTCPVCLDCFETNMVQKLAEHFDLLNSDEYVYNNFFFNVSFPKCLAIRTHSMLMHLKKMLSNDLFNSLYPNSSEQPLEQPHKIFRCVASEIFSKALNKDYHPKSNLSFLVTIGYEHDNIEVENFKLIINNKNTSNKKRKNIEVSRNNIGELLKDINDEEFAKYFSVPMPLSDKDVFLEKIDITADPIYLGGRYLKFKRNVGQTPWVIDGVSVAEHNIQDIIFDALFSVMRYNKNELTFTSSGREDVDVRMLGTGRPFYIKIENPRQRQISNRQLSKIENIVINSKLAAVIKLQSIYASDLNRIKFGEEKKTKKYKALCHTLSPNLKEALEIINGQKENLKISQLTVIRVLHRRTLLSREKIIHTMTAVAIPGYDNMFELEVKTQAGTYVKEFVHGDFGRTEPSISSIIGYPTDIVALDCVNIDLIWPEEVKKTI